MNKYELYQLNQRLQFRCRCAINVLHHQNYYAGMQCLQHIHMELEQYLGGIMQESEFLDNDTQALLVQSLQAIMQAQENEDYVLLADVIEIQLLTDLDIIQNKMRENLSAHEDESEIWNKNIDIIRRDVKLIDTVKLISEECKNKSGSLEREMWTEQTNSGAKTLAAKDEKGIFYFHSNVDPYYEAWQFANWYYRPEEKKYVVYGLGLGYHIEALMNLDESIHVRVFEQDINVIYYFMRSRIQNKILSNPHIEITYDPELKNFADALQENVVVVMHHPSLRHIKQKNVRERMGYMFIRDSGIRNLYNLMVSNFRENVVYCTHNVDELHNQFQGKRAVIVAAGPSLDRNIDALKQKPSDVLIVSTGTVFHKLLQCGIGVDYVIVSDAQPSIRKQFQQDFDRDIPVLILSTASKCVATEYAGDKYIIYQKDYPLSENTARVKKTNMYETGGSVSTTALDVCLRLGCRSVAYIGLDLAYTDGKGHTTGTAGVETMDTSDMRMVPGYELTSAGIGYKKIDVEVASSHLFDMYRQWIEDRVSRTETPVFDATEGGSVIEGLEIITLKQYLQNV